MHGALCFAQKPLISLLAYFLACEAAPGSCDDKKGVLLPASCLDEKVWLRGFDAALGCATELLSQRDCYVEDSRPVSKELVERFYERCCQESMFSNLVIKVDHDWVNMDRA